MVQNPNATTHDWQNPDAYVPFREINYTIPNPVDPPAGAIFNIENSPPIVKPKLFTPPDARSNVHWLPSADRAPVVQAGHEHTVGFRENLNRVSRRAKIIAALGVSTVGLLIWKGEPAFRFVDEHMPFPSLGAQIGDKTLNKVVPPRKPIPPHLVTKNDVRILGDSETVLAPGDSQG